MRQFVWTIRLLEEREPFLWVTHVGPATAAFIESHVAKLTSAGHSVVVGFSRRKTR